MRAHRPPVLQSQSRQRWVVSLSLGAIAIMALGLVYVVRYGAPPPSRSLGQELGEDAPASRSAPWALVLPPLLSDATGARADVSAPLSQWEAIGGFLSERHCREARFRLRMLCADGGRQGPTASGTRCSAALCVPAYKLK